jgi:CheY-like chemotaxis protein
MEATQQLANCHSLSVVLDANAAGVVNGCWMAVRAEVIDTNRVFLLTQSYIAPQTVFELELGVSLLERPVRSVVRTLYVERTREGFGIGCEFENMSMRDQQRWRLHCQHLRLTPIARAFAPAKKTWGRYPPTILVVGLAISAKITKELSEHGVIVRWAADIESSVSAIERYTFDFVVADGSEGVALCQHLSQVRSAQSVVLRTRRAQSADLAHALKAGAVMAMDETGEQRFLATRLLSLL